MEQNVLESVIEYLKLPVQVSSEVLEPADGLDHEEA